MLAGESSKEPAGHATDTFCRPYRMGSPPNVTSTSIRPLDPLSTPTHNGPSQVGFQSYSQKDPFQEWTIQSNELFNKLSAKVYRNSAISWLSLDAAGIVARPSMGSAVPASPVVSDDDDVADPVAAVQARTKTALNPADASGPSRAERRAAKKGGKSRRPKSR